MVIIGLINRRYLGEESLQKLNLAGHLSIGYMLLILLAYYLIIILIYSATKSYALVFIQNTSKKIKFSLSKFFRFYLSNLMIFFGSFTLLTILLLMCFSIFNKEVYPTAGKIVLVVFAFFFYAFININHSLFMMEKGAKSVLKKSLGFTGKIRKYIQIYIVTLFLIGFYLLLFLIIGSIAQAANIDYTLYTNIFTAATGIYALLLLGFNRMYFYYLVKKNVLS